MEVGIKMPRTSFRVKDSIALKWLGPKPQNYSTLQEFS